jgi:FAD-dependent urate hydroxylase
MVHDSTDCEVAIIGAGPYGLSAASHLTASGRDVRIFGEPMEFWANGMPHGMLLRSPREASTIADPRSAFTLEAYENASGIEPVKRVPRETFVDYGRWYQKQLIHNLDRRKVAKVIKKNSVFELTLSDGAIITSRRVVVAAGVGPFKKLPKQFSNLDPSHASHCYEGRPFETLGNRVAVIGAGQSALESAAILHELGKDVEVIARIPNLRWIGMHKRLHQLGPISKVLYSKHDVGPIGISRLVAYPKLMYFFPMGPKDIIRARAIRSAGAPWLIPRLRDVKVTLGRSIVSAQVVGDEVQLTLDDQSERRVDHVLLGTGYRVDISQYRFLTPELVNDVRQLDGYPEITSGFASSVPGLHFIGATAARNLGPLMYFVTGTDFASRELAAHMGRNGH